MPTPPAKADDAKDEKPWEAAKKARRGKKDPAAALEKDDGDDEDEDEEDDEDDKQVGKSGGFRADLKAAIELLSQHSADHDPSLRREALLAKELRGGGLDKSERAELIAFLDDGPPAGGLGDRVLKSAVPQEAMSKAMAHNPALGQQMEGYQKSLALFADALEKSQTEAASTSYLMARTLTRVAETLDATLEALERRDGAQAEALARSERQPAHPPTSYGLGYREKSLGGRDGGGEGGDVIEKSSRQKLSKALTEMAEAQPRNSSLREAFEMARLGLRINQPMMPQVAERVREHLSQAD